jgi:hypothetical protein
MSTNIPLFSFFDPSTGHMIVQNAPYIDDGWYIEIRDGGLFHLFEIPTHGGEAVEIDAFRTFALAYDAAQKLT